MARPISANAAALQREAICARRRCWSKPSPASPKITFVIRSCRKKLLPVPENPTLPRLSHAVALLQRADDGVERRSLLRSRGEIEAAQDRGRLVARRLEDAIEEVGDRLSDRAELRRKAEQDRPRPQVRLLLQALGHPLRDALDEEVDLLRNLADVVGLLVGGLERRAPHACRFASSRSAKYWVKPIDEIHLGEDGVDGEVDLQLLVQFVEALADRVGVRRHLRRPTG